MKRSLLLGLTGIFLSLLAEAALAQGANLTQPDTSMQSLLDLIVNASGQWTGRLEGYAVRLLFLLAAIQFVWNFVPMLFRSADLGEIAHGLISTVLVTGFFYALIKFSPEWAQAIVESFRKAGAHASGLPTEKLMPGDMFATAVEFSEKMMSGISVFSPATSFLVSIAAIIVLLCFAFIAAFMFVTLVESYFIINAAVFFFGFGGSQWTREYAIAPLRFAVAIGAKLFVLTLLVGIIMSVAAQWEAAYRNDSASVLTLVGLSLVCAYLTKSLSELVQSMISGASMGGGHAIGSMAAAGAAGAAAAVATIATAGAAAPAAAGALGAAGTGGAAGAAGGAAGGGLASLINSSFAEQAGAASAESTAGGMASSAGSNAAKAAAPRLGGGAASNPAPKPISSGMNQAAAKAAGQVPQNGEDKSQMQTQPASVPLSDSGHSKAHTLASGAVRMAGVLSAMSVPGMEGAAGLSVNAPAARSAGEASTENGSAADDPENVIRPASAAPTEAKATPSPAADAPKPASSLAALRVPGMASYSNPQGA
ncbi:P-type conjugative transfer protein TrbL [Pseudomonas aeruginosa]|nr:P-type conjugative transfer protein TrbL [Pseudomonas aeruginosa]